MKPGVFNAKLDEISSKMTDSPQPGTTKLDLNCLTEGERLLFQRITEFAEKHGSHPNLDELAQEWPFISKGLEIMRWHGADLFQTSMKTGDPVKDWFFNLHLVNFLHNLNKVYDNLERWTEKDRQEFLDSTDLDKVFIIPSSSKDLASSRQKKREFRRKVDHAKVT